MAVQFRTSTPQALLNKFDAAIHQAHANGKITTWERNHQGFYTHKAADWRAKAYFKAVVGNGVLTFIVLPPANSTVSIPAYSYYHGHLIETFLNHFDKDFSAADATALPSFGDRVAA